MNNKRYPVKQSPWRWPAAWFRDQNFWREVTARALSGLIVILVGYVVLAANGLLGLPSPVKMISALLVVGVAALLMWPLVKLSQSVIGIVRRKVRTIWLRIALLTAWSAAFLLMLTYIWLIAQAVALWALKNAPE
ncbi:hypothetical protein [Arthrobacter sp. fls2-241-R2A-172]|uniref:hypothetical protein n=1 Tax=Arthrobacter sp. fls2-241-R2A-172 TaxID=3040325 RepID=UPI00254F1846|nr:hypothetical protein [Arthrobacter sp. fls2-241-R2A-172]